MTPEPSEKRDEAGRPTDHSLAAIERRYEKASDMVSALCKPRNTEGARDWVMSIPARPDHDPDLIIEDALADIPRLLKRVRRLEAEREGE